MDHRGQSKIQRPQAENGKDVRCIDDIGILRNRKDCGDRVDREDHISQFNHHKRQKKGRHIERQFSGSVVRYTDKKTLAVQIVCHPEPRPHKPQHGIGGNIIFTAI